MRPRKYALSLAVALLLSISASARAADNKTPNLFADCAVDLVFPTDGLLARSAGGSSGPIIVSMRLGTGGRVESLKFDGGGDLFNRQIAQAMNASKFASKCAGQTLRFVFSFTIDGEPSNCPGVWMSFASPDRFTLHTHPKGGEILRTRKP